MEKNKIGVWVKAPCDEKVRKELMERFGETCTFEFRSDTRSVPIESAEVIIGEPSETEIRQAKNLRWVQLTWVGADKYVKMKDILSEIILTNASGAFGKIIAEYVIGNIISLYRSFPEYWKNQKNHIWKKNDSAYTICGKQALILGAGDIGRNIAYRLKSFDAFVIGIRRRRTAPLPPEFDEVYDLSSLDELIPNADIVIGCLPDISETRGLITYKRLNSMKKDAVLINVGRGSLIHNKDLIEVLKSGHLKGVALDVLETEPLLDESPLWDMENVIITPHIAGPGFGGNADVQKIIWDICTENIERYLNGRELRNVVSLYEGY